MKIGSINAGSSVALNAAAGEIIGLLQDIQQRQIDAAKLVAEAQGVFAQGAADACENAANNEADGLVQQAISAGVSAATSAVSFAHSTFELVQLNTLHTTQQAEIKQLEEFGGKLGKGAVTPVLTSQAPVDMKAKVDAAVTVIKKGNISAHGLSDVEVSALRDSEVATLKTAIKERITKLNDDYKHSSEISQMRVGALSKLTEMSSKIADGVTTAKQAEFKRAAGAAQATQTLDNTASQQTNSVYDGLVQSRAKIADEISQVLQAKNQAIDAMNYRG